MYDAIVVGARCAGASTAMLLARKGFKVLLVDRARFPSDIPHGHFLHREGPRRLKRWGLLDKVVASNCPPVTTCISDFGDFPLVAENLVLDGVAWGYGPRRRVFDKILADAAVAAGVELREGFTVERFFGDGEAISGICARESAGGSRVTERARMTIGADGRNSLLARTVDAPRYREAPAVLCYYFSYWSGVPCDGLEMYLRDRRMIFTFPTNDGQLAAFVGFPVEEFHRVRGDIPREFMQAIDLVPGLGERLRDGAREERFYGIRDLPNFFRRPYGPGWALVGDAGHHKDPFLALGMSDALRDAELLSEAIADGLSGSRPLDAALADYERRRNAATFEIYEENLRSAQFTPPPPELNRLRFALRGNPEDTTRFWMARVGMIPSTDFFNPENLQRILARANLAGARS
jgi:flavin-dependent dehydrogenase